jgi:hypothetical protein
MVFAWKREERLEDFSGLVFWFKIIAITFSLKGKR